MPVQTEMNEGIAVLTIDDPPANALGEKTLDALRETVGPLLEDDRVRVLVIRGAGEKIFVAGANINELIQLNEESGKALAEKCKEVLFLIHRASKPVLAAINGVAAGGGLELALCCDIRLASKAAKLGLPEVTLGVLPAAGGTQLLPRVIGSGKALEMMLTGDLISADAALGLGLVDRVVAPLKLMTETLDLAGRISKMPPLAVKEIKAAVVDASWRLLAHGLDKETLRFARLCATEDKQEGVKAFLERRRPVFKGV